MPALLIVSLVYFLRPFVVFWWFWFFLIRCFVVLSQIDFFVNMYYQIYTRCSQQDLGSPL